MVINHQSPRAEHEGERVVYMHIQYLLHNYSVLLYIIIPRASLIIHIISKGRECVV